MIISRIPLTQHTLVTGDTKFFYYVDSSNVAYISFIMAETYLGYRPSSLVKKAASISVPTFIGTIDNSSCQINMGVIKIEDVIKLAGSKLHDTRKTFDGIVPWLQEIQSQIKKRHTP